MQIKFQSQTFKAHLNHFLKRIKNKLVKKEYLLEISLSEYNFPKVVERVVRKIVFIEYKLKVGEKNFNPKFVFKSSQNKNLYSFG